MLFLKFLAYPKFRGGLSELPYYCLNFSRRGFKWVASTPRYRGGGIKRRKIFLRHSRSFLPPLLREEFRASPEKRGGLSGKIAILMGKLQFYLILLYKNIITMSMIFTTKKSRIYDIFVPN